MILNNNLLHLINKKTLKLNDFNSIINIIKIIINNNHL